LWPLNDTLPPHLDGELLAGWEGIGRDEDGLDIIDGIQEGWVVDGLESVRVPSIDSGLVFTKVVAAPERQSSDNFFGGQA
jgi:hypothetical protein